MSEPCRTCAHIKTDGSLCQSPAMRLSAFCYFHTRDHERLRNLSQASDTSAHQQRTDAFEAEVMRSLAIPDLEDAHAVQVALSAIIRAIALGHITTLRANLLLRGLRSAIVNLRNLPPFEQTELIATEDPRPISPLIVPCAPDPWVVRDEPAAANNTPAENPPAPFPISEIDLNVN